MARRRRPVEDVPLAVAFVEDVVDLDTFTYRSPHMIALVQHARMVARRTALPGQLVTERDHAAWTERLGRFQRPR
jgi:hypothetical protein